MKKLLQAVFQKNGGKKDMKKQRKGYILIAVRTKMHYIQRNNNKIFADFAREILEA